MYYIDTDISIKNVLSLRFDYSPGLLGSAFTAAG